MRRRNIPVIRRTQLGDGSILSRVVGNVKELPTVNVNVALQNDTRNTLLGVAGIFALGMIGAKLI